MKRITPHLTYANVVATIALILALGGTAWALTVTGADVKDRSLTGADIQSLSIPPRTLATNSITTAKIAPGAITSAKVADSSITSSDLNAALAAQTINPAVVQSVTTGSIPTGQTITSAPTCGSGDAIGGGATFDDPPSNAQVVRSWPSDAHTWSSTINNMSGGPLSYTAYAVCLS